jgi:hypothetical protein
MDAYPHPTITMHPAPDHGNGSNWLDRETACLSRLSNQLCLKILMSNMENFK